MIISPINTKNIENRAEGQRRVIRLCGIGKKYPLNKARDKGFTDSLLDFWALKDVSLEIVSGEILGIIGRNGAGKTTLLNIIAQTISPTQGEAITEGRALGLFNLGVGFQDELTGRENIFLNGAILGATRKELELKLRPIIEFSELGDFINMPVGSYSQGMRLRLGFSIIANLDFDVLVVDEVLSVGDALFQNKCYQRLMDFKRAGKTLVITTQSMELIERLSDRVALLDHGLLLFLGQPKETINKYRALLNTEKFYVGPMPKRRELIYNTKKWADDTASWGQKFGTKEVIIDSVEFINKFGIKTNRIKSQDSLKIKVNFTARSPVKEPHFGVAIFRNDGVYCYGPNTKFDGYRIPELQKGNGHFNLEFHKVFLAPGEYRVSVAIWDKNETLAFDYHYGCYKLIITGNHNAGGELLNMPFKFCLRDYLNFQRKNRDALDLSILSDKWRQKIEAGQIEIESLRLLNHVNEQKEVFMTNELVKLMINFNKISHVGKEYYLWVGLYRDDGVYCQGMVQALNRSKNLKVIFPKLPLLPGSYRISLGVWDGAERKFIICHHAVYPFRMVFDRQDHGTVYLRHRWRWDYGGVGLRCKE